MEREVEENQVRTGASVRDIKGRFGVDSERHHVERVGRLWASFAEPGREKETCH